MTDGPYVTRAEFAMLERQVAANYQRLEAIDQGGTRGVAVLQLQIADLSRDMATHEEQHRQEELRRSSARRWATGMVVAIIAAIDGPLVALWLARR